MIIYMLLNFFHLFWLLYYTLDISTCFIYAVMKIWYMILCVRLKLKVKGEDWPWPNVQLTSFWHQHQRQELKLTVSHSCNRFCFCSCRSHLSTKWNRPMMPWCVRRLTVLLITNLHSLLMQTWTTIHNWGEEWRHLPVSTRSPKKVCTLLVRKYDTTRYLKYGTVSKYIPT